jgi:hypothetical protein
MFHLLDLVGFVPDRSIWAQHLLEEESCAVRLRRHAFEVGVELLFSRDQTETHEQASLPSEPLDSSKNLGLN